MISIAVAQQMLMFSSSLTESWRKEVADIPQGVVQDQLTKGGSLFQLANKEFEGSEVYIHSWTAVSA